MRKLIILFLFISCGFSSIAQELDSLLKQELFSYYDSSRIILQNSRRLVFKYVEKNEPVKVKAILSYTRRKLNPYIYRVFTDDELELLNFYLGRYEDILLNPRSHYHYSYRGYGYHGEYYGHDYPDIDYRYSINLDVVIASQADFIMNQIQDSEVTEEEKAFLSLYFKHKVHLEKDLTMEAVQFINAYPESKYADYVKKDIRRWMIRGDYSFDVYFGGGQSILSDQFEETIHHRSTLVYGMDGSINRAMIGLRMATTYGEVLNEFSHRGDAFTNGMPIYTFNYTVNVGYSILDFDFLRITPSVDFGGVYTSVPEHKVEEFPEDPSIGAISYGFGGAIDIFPFQKIGNYTETLHRIGLRLHGGRLYNNLKNKNVLLDGHQDYFGISLIYDASEMKVDMN